MKFFSWICLSTVFFLFFPVDQQQMMRTNLEFNPIQKKPFQYDYEEVPGDPLGVKIYTMENGMKLYLSVNKREPKIQTNIAVRAGSKHDPEDATGLAHYLEHMLFKGTDEIGALDWPKEKIMLGSVSYLYEQMRGAKNEKDRKEIYRKIDRMSNRASQLAVANEFDKLLKSIGATGINAYTSVEQTVYTSMIPANELERWMQLESERFSQLVLRLFHTELETVYEEFNRNQESDNYWLLKTIKEALFPNHPYGTQTTIGTGEHLKNPSMVKIEEYFEKYYVPNNMAMVLSGNFDPDQVVELAEKYFGGFKSQEVPKFRYDDQPELTQPVVKEIYSQQKPSVSIAWRFEGTETDEPLMVNLMEGILYNGKVGLLDLYVTQKQKALDATAWTIRYKDYTIFGVSGEPREGQSLDEVKTLLLDQVDMLKRGNFETWVVDAIIKDQKLNDIRRMESNQGRVYAMTNAFVKGIAWEDYTKRFETMEAFRKGELIDFAANSLDDGHVVVYKRTGTPQNLLKVEKPEITPIELNRDKSSTFAASFLETNSSPLEPAFINFEEKIQSEEIEKGLRLDHLANAENELFNLYYIIEMGSLSDPKLDVAIDYLPFLGTSDFSAEELKQEFYKLGLDFSVRVDDRATTIQLQGLKESFEEGVQLLETLLTDVKGDEEALKNLINDILAKRANDKKDKRTIFRTALGNYVQYGPESPFTNKLSKDQLNAFTAKELEQLIKSLITYEHTVFYYGPETLEDVENVLDYYHKPVSKLKPVLPAREFERYNPEEDMIFFVDYPMVQAEVLLFTDATPNYSLEDDIMEDWFNNYFGTGLTSVVFQEIREAKGLAYRTYAYYASPTRKDAPHTFQAYVGTQADKLQEAITAMAEVMDEMPVSEPQIEQVRKALIKDLESDRINSEQIYFTYRRNKKLGYPTDLRKEAYERLRSVSTDDFLGFYKNKIKTLRFNKMVVMADKESIDMEYLKTLGTLKELTLEELFGY